MTVQILVLTVTIAGLSRREDLIAALDVAQEHLLRMNLLDVFLQDEIISKQLQADVTGNRSPSSSSGIWQRFRSDRCTRPVDRFGVDRAFRSPAPVPASSRVVRRTRQLLID